MFDRNSNDANEKSNMQSKLASTAQKSKPCPTSSIYHRVQRQSDRATTGKRKLGEHRSKKQAVSNEYLPAYDKEGIGISKRSLKRHIACKHHPIRIRRRDDNIDETARRQRRRDDDDASLGRVIFETSLIYFPHLPATAASLQCSSNFSTPCCRWRRGVKGVMQVSVSTSSLSFASRGSIMSVCSSMPSTCSVLHM